MPNGHDNEPILVGLHQENMGPSISTQSRRQVAKCDICHGSSREVFRLGGGLSRSSLAIALLVDMPVAESNPILISVSALPVSDRRWIPLGLGLLRIWSSSSVVLEGADTPAVESDQGAEI